MFYFPCFLFAFHDGDTAWTEIGQTDLKKIPEKIKKHNESSRHINCAIDLSHLGRANIAAALDTGHALFVAGHNESVTKNRAVLSKIINCIKFCGNFELPLRGHDEHNDSLNPGVFRELVDFTPSLDTSFKSHLESAAVFKGSSKTIQNELLEIHKFWKFVNKKLKQGRILHACKACIACLANCHSIKEN